MNITKWSQFAELVSSIVVVITLLVLIVELQANTQEMRTNNAREVILSSGELNAQLALNAEMAEILVKGRNEEPLTEAEQQRLTSWLRTFVRNFETAHYMFEAGALDETVLSAYRARFRNFLNTNPKALAGIDGCIECYSPSFVEWVNSIVLR